MTERPISPQHATMAQRRYDPQATRQAILEAATRVFVEQGVADAPLSEVAKAAGVTKSLIHHHFGSKEELWNEVKLVSFQRYFEPVLRTIRSDLPHLQVLQDVIRHMFFFLRDNPEVARMMGWMALEKDEITIDLHDKVCAEGLARIVNSQREGALRNDVHPASIMATFISLTRHWWHLRHVVGRWQGGDGTPDMPAEADLDDQFFSDMLKIFMEGVRPR